MSVLGLAIPESSPREAPRSTRLIEVEGLVKRYRHAGDAAIDGLSFGVGTGEVFGLLGPNGAGKSTTVGVLTTRILPTAGTATIAGIDVVHDPVRAHSRLGVVPQRNNLDRSLSCRANLIFHAAYHGVPPTERKLRADRLLEQFGMLEKTGRRVDQLSGGEAQRLMIARALMHHPEVLFLDEPTTGLDPAARLFVWERIRELKDQGAAIVLCTHDMDEAAALADRVGIMDHGRLLALDTPRALVRSLPSGGALEVGLVAAAARPDDDGHELWNTLRRLPGVDHLEPIASQDDLQRARLYVTGEAAAMVVPVSQTSQSLGAILAEVQLSEPSLEDVFIHLTGRRLR